MPRTKLLFVCTANYHRSPTAEELFRSNKKYRAKSCGTDVFAEKQVDEKLIRWADIIFCMEDIHKDFILENFPGTRKDIRVLDIPDVYPRNDPKLIEILRERLREFL